MNFLKWIKSLFKDTSYQDNVESYILSKQPKSAAEIEFWIRHYDYQTSRRNFI